MLLTVLRLSRRSFINRLLLGLAALLQLPALSRCRSSDANAPLPLGKVDQFNQPVTPLELFRVVITSERSAGTRRLAALSLVCSHQTCLLRHNRATGALQCPCHGSQFGPRGEVLRGPATKPLEWYRLSVGADGALILHRGEVVSPDWRLELPL